MIIAYLVNQYPRVSHSFIRREIMALEDLGLTVHRYSLRSCRGELVDARDVVEADKTTVILANKWKMARSVALVGLRNPRRFLRALREFALLNSTSQRGLVAHLAYLAEACFLVIELRLRNVQHLHAHFGTNPAAVALLCRLLGGPNYSFTVHGPEEFDKASLLALDRKAREAKFIVAISDYCKSQLMRLVNPEDHPKLRVIRCGLDRGLLELRVSPIPDTSRLVCIGRLSDEKGHMVLLQALSNLASQNIPFELLLLGDGAIRPKIEQRIQVLGLESLVTITGYASQERVVQELLAARALVLPSLAEGLPVVIMEAFALGRPVLSTYIAGIPELVVPGQNGWLVPAGSVEALTAALVDVLNCPIDVLQSMSNQGTRLVRSRHDVTVSAMQLRQLFDEN